MRMLLPRYLAQAIRIVPTDSFYDSGTIGSEPYDTGLTMLISLRAIQYGASMASNVMSLKS